MKRVKRTARPRNPAATREALIDAAAAIFRREGYFATDSNAIARAAGYAPASFYKHFAGKPAVLMAVYERYRAAEWDGLSAAVSGARPGPASIVKALSFLEGFHAEWATFRTALRMVALMDDGAGRAVREARVQQLEALARLTGVSAKTHHAALLTILALTERYADLALEAESLGVKRQDLRQSVTKAVAALLPQ
jgi:AcrR family transcriptional regulator